jgi:hypothetical protein
MVYRSPRRFPVRKLKPCREDDVNPQLAEATPGFACAFSASPTCTPISVLTTITVIVLKIQSALRAPRL